MARHPTGERTLADLLDERTDADPGGVFLVFEDAGGTVGELTYAAFRARVQRCARGFADLGVAVDDCVVVHLRNSPELLVAWFALTQLGAIVVPSNVANTSPELEHVFAVSEARVAVTEPDYRDAVAAALPAGAELVVARGDAAGARAFADLEAAVGEAPRPDLGPLQVAELIFTSGTTKKPKAVMLTHAHCLRAGLDAVHSLWLQPGERCLTALPLFHVNAQAMSLLAALTVGGTLVLLEEFRASKFWGQVQRHEATQTAIVAMQLRVLIAQPPRDGEREHALRRVFYAINVPTPEKERFEARFGVSVINGYGLSEAMTLTTVAPVVGPRRWPSIGLPSPGRRVLLLDEQGVEVPPGVVGEIVVEGTPGRDLMLGYYRDQEETAGALRGGRLHTGDNAHADADGYLYFFDRKKDMIKRAGENVSAMEVEAVLLEHPAVAEVAVVGVPDDIRDEAVAAAVVLAAGGEPDVAALQAFCAERLARFKVPTLVVYRDALPKTSIGKVRKEALRKELAGEAVG
jgi:crotonobetaine/carnitine-CoA ligase